MKQPFITYQEIAEQYIEAKLKNDRAALAQFPPELVQELETIGLFWKHLFNQEE